MCKTHLVLALLPSTSPATSQRRLPLHLRHTLQRPLPLSGDVLSSAGDRSQNKDAGYVENQQQNIADAIDLLPRLTTGINVNIKFTRIDDFEFTRECAIFDLLDIPLYHGWIVDPQDSDTSSAIGLKSYNTIMGELVALETQNVGNDVNTPEEDCVDFVAATTASLGVPSPSLSRVKSFDISEDKKERKGDLQEEEDLIKALELSVTEGPTNNDSDVKTPESVIPGEVYTDSGAENDKALKISETESLTTVDNTIGSDLKTPESVIPGEVDTDPGAENDKALKISETISANDSDLKKQESVIPEELHPPCSQKPSTDNNGMSNSGNDLTFKTVPSQEACCSSQMDNESKDEIVGNDVNAEESSKGKDVIYRIDESKSKSKALTTHVDESEPIYEGEEHIQETSTPSYENGEPMYEGEVALAEQVDKGKNGIITPRQGELIRNFLRNSASQLTIYGLFQLQEGLKERELCVFFRNNHFNTMFKFEGELYLLATDQGYINQPDLVWEKLNEVNGDSVFMTGNFKKFNAESQDTSPHTWDEQNALANTADYLASIDNVTQENTGFNSDLQLAIALQQQEFEQQQPQPPPTTTTESGLVTGPQHVQPSRPKNSSSSSKHESKSSKEKCTVM